MLIDVHGHLGRVLTDRREFMDVTNVIAKMDAWGIDLTCMMALSEHPEGAYLESSTEDVLAAWPPEALLDCEALAESIAPSPRSDDLCLLIVRFGLDTEPEPGSEPERD